MKAVWEQTWALWKRIPRANFLFALGLGLAVSMGDLYLQHAVTVGLFWRVFILDVLGGFTGLFLAGFIRALVLRRRKTPPM